MATVTWSGLGSISASWCRESTLANPAVSEPGGGVKEIDPPTCRIILGTACAQAAELVGVFLEIQRDVAGLGVAHVDVQQRRAGVVAVHRRLDLILPGDWQAGQSPGSHMGP